MSSGFRSAAPGRGPQRGCHAGGPRLARREDGEYLEYLTEEQRRQPGAPAARLVRGGVEAGCPAWKALLIQPIQATRANLRVAMQSGCVIVSPTSPTISNGHLSPMQGAFDRFAQVPATTPNRRCR